MLRYDNGPFGQFPGLPGFGMAGAPGCRVRLGRRRALRSVTMHRAAGAFFFLFGDQSIKKTYALRPECKRAVAEAIHSNLMNRAWQSDPPVTVSTAAHRSADSAAELARDGFRGAARVPGCLTRGDTTAGAPLHTIALDLVPGT